MKANTARKEGGHELGQKLKDIDFAGLSVSFRTFWQLSEDYYYCYCYYCFIRDAVGLRKPPKQSKTSAFDASSGSGLSSSARCVTPEDSTFRFLDVLNNTVFPLRALLHAQSLQYMILRYCRIICFNFCFLVFKSLSSCFVYSARLLWATCCWQSFK
jgi:hypothetical protein